MKKHIPKNYSFPIIEGACNIKTDCGLEATLQYASNEKQDGFLETIEKEKFFYPIIDRGTCTMVQGFHLGTAVFFNPGGKGWISYFDNEGIQKTKRNSEGCISFTL